MVVRYFEKINSYILFLDYFATISASHNKNLRFTWK